MSICSNKFCLILFIILIGCGGSGSSGSLDNNGGNNSNANQNPYAPSNLITKPIDESSVKLTWDPAVDSDGTIESYHIYITNNDSFGSAYSSTTNTDTIISGLQYQTNYLVKVTSVDNSGDESLDGAIISVATQKRSLGLFYGPTDGLSYKTATQSGTTMWGQYYYYEGETISFYLGDILLGQTTAKSMISPIDLVPSAVDAADASVINICRLLQTLDYDKHLDGGIQFFSNTLNALSGLQINFNQGIIEFENDLVVQNLMKALNLNLRSVADTQAHLKATLTNWGKTGSSFSSDLEAGFPIGIPGLNGMYRGSPAIHALVGDIDGDNYKEILFTGLASGPLYAIGYDGSLKTTFGDIAGAAYPALGRINASSTGLDVVFGTFALHSNVSAYSGTGSILPGWPVNNVNYVTSTPALADIDNDGKDEIFIGAEDWGLHGYRADGTFLPGWPVFSPPYIYNGETIVGGQSFSAPAIGDIDNDGELEVVAVNENRSVYAIKRDGTLVKGFPFTFFGLDNTFPVIGDVDNDDQYEIIIGGYIADDDDDGPEGIKIISNSGTIKYTIDLSYYAAIGHSVPVLADLNSDGVPEIIYLTAGYLHVFTFNGNAFTSLPGWPQRLSNYSQIAMCSPVVGDVDGDGLQEIVVTASGSEFEEDRILVFKPDGTLHPKFPKVGHIGGSGTPAIADIDNDGRNEIIIRGDDPVYNPIIWVYDLGGNSNGAIEWGQLGRDYKHTSLYK